MEYKYVEGSGRWQSRAAVSIVSIELQCEVCGWQGEAESQSEGTGTRSPKHGSLFLPPLADDDYTGNQVLCAFRREPASARFADYAACRLLHALDWNDGCSARKCRSCSLKRPLVPGLGLLDAPDIRMSMYFECVLNAFHAA